MERLETIPRMNGVEEGLAARVHDPLWMLARQYQFGEFTSENAASVAWVEVEAEYHRLDRWRPITASDNEAIDDLPYDAGTEPLERLVEQEPSAHVDVALRVEGGARWARMLNEAGLGDLLDRFAQRNPIAMPTPTSGPVSHVRRRLPDGVGLLGTLVELVSPDEMPVTAAILDLPAESRPRIIDLAGEWLAWSSSRPLLVVESTLAGHPRAWNAHRMDYEFELGSSTLPAVRLRAEGYRGGRLDWSAVDASIADPAPAAGPATTLSITGVPAPARFGGMPVARFWEMEDARFDPGAIDASPNDLGRLLLTAFATVYGNDWFVLPMRLPVGTLSRITSFTVNDVFGGTRSLGASGADVDGWNLFGLTDASHPLDPGVERPTVPWFYLSPTMPNGLEGRAIESVQLLRDEMANLAWAVEASVETPAGVVDRHEQWVADQPEPEPAGDVPRYRVDVVVPRHWYPLAPEQLSDQESVRLRLAPLSRVDAPAEFEQPDGVLLADQDGTVGRLWLFEEEVPRSGAVVERRRQHARWHDGSVHVWTGRSKHTGAGEGSSGLRFDIIEP